MGGSGGAKGSSSTEASIAPELKPLFAQTGSTVAGLQSNITPYFDQFFTPQVQSIPGFTPGQEMLNTQLQQNAFNSPMNLPQMEAFNSLRSLVNSPVGSSPMTQAAMAAARDPILNDLAAAGMGNSDAIGTSLGGAYAPILAQEMQQRFAAVPMLNQMGASAYAQGQQNLNAYGQSEEQRRGIQEAGGQAVLADLLRRQGLGTQFTTGILGGFPAVGGSTTTTKQSGGGK